MGIWEPAQLGNQRKTAFYAILLRGCKNIVTGRVMIEQLLLKRITSNPEIFGGKPIIRGMRISVELVLSLMAQGESVEVLLEDYPDLTREDIQACLMIMQAGNGVLQQGDEHDRKQQAELGYGAYSSLSRGFFSRNCFP
jgi:uncharacterized protein (DUF433 family)